MEQIYHVTRCAEACKGEVQCWTCHKCHEFKKWHSMCNTLKSPVELLRKLSKGKRASHTSGGGPSANRRGKAAVNDDFAVMSRQESHGLESMWLPEMEDRTSLVPQEIASQNAALELDASVNNLPLPLQPRNYEMARPLPTPPSTRDNSWSELSQNSVANGDIKVVTHEQPPPYIVSPQTTVDGYQPQDDITDSLRLGIPPVQYIKGSTLIESPEEMESDPELWANHAVFGATQDAQIDLQFLPTVSDAAASSRYDMPSEKSASIFSSPLPASQMPNPHMQKKNTWPMQLDNLSDIPRPPPPFGHQQRHTLDGGHSLTEQNFPTATGGQGIEARLSTQRQTSFDAGTQDSITVAQETHAARVPGYEHQPPAQRRHPARRGARERKQAGPAQHEYEECTRCSQRFGGIPKNRKQHLKRHWASKHGDVRFRCAQPGCRRSYNRVDNLHDHERKCHPRSILSQQSESPVVAELAAGDVDMRERPSAASVESAAGWGRTGRHHQREDPGAMETHLAVYGYSMPTQEEHGWDHHASVGDDHWDLGGRRRIRSTAGMMIDTDEWNVLIAGASGGQHDYEDGAEMKEAGPPDVEDDGLAPRPLDLPCVSWRA